MDSFPCEKSDQGKAKVIEVPFELCKPVNGGKVDLKQGSGAKSTQEDRWFRAPPKVKLTAGILGSAPGQSTRVELLEEGERKVGGDPESRHRVRSSPPHPPQLAQIGSPKPQPPPVDLGFKIPNLAKIVGHLWRGSPTKSYASALKSSPAKIVQVKMDRGGGDRRGYGREGAGAGRQDRGDGRPGSRKNVWERTGPRVQDQPARI